MDVNEIEAMIQDAIILAWDKKLPIPAPPDFDEAAYLKANPDLSQAVERGEIQSPFVHYVRFGRREGRPRYKK